LNEKRINLKKTLEALPPQWPHELLPEIQKQITDNKVKVAVLDDDPTGTQTVHDVSVLTKWSTDAIEKELLDPNPVFYILTNSRSLPLDEAKKLNHEIGRHLTTASKKVGRAILVISRSDSTLRGHFPGEVQALAEALGQEFDAWLIVPFFLEGGRYTINNVHYVAQEDDLVPAGQTEFARDAAFGYRSSNLSEWVEEKTKGQISASQVASISLEDIRNGGPERVSIILKQLPQGSMCVVNAASYRDMEVFALGMLKAEGLGKKFLLRTAASIVRVRAGIPPRSLLTTADMNLTGNRGGLIVVGSYVPKTTKQIETLLSESKVTSIEVNVDTLLDESRVSCEINGIIQKANQALGMENDVVIYTSRRLIKGSNANESLAIGQKISEGLVSIVRSIRVKPRYLLAKGGITSSDIATEALGIERAKVLGQILPGVPVWQLGRESRWSGLNYIVFPGNVGNNEAIKNVVRALRRSSLSQISTGE